MDTGTILSIVSLAIVTAGVVVAWVTLRHSDGKDKSQADGETLKNSMTLALIPTNELISKLDTRMSVAESNLDLLMAELRRKMAKIVHSPDPARAHVDALMDKLIDDIPLTPAEHEETRDILVKMMHWEPGQDIGFPVRDGEQASAAWLLLSLEYESNRRKQRDQASYLGS